MPPQRSFVTATADGLAGAETAIRMEFPTQISRLKAKLGTWRDLFFSVISRQEADAWVPTATTL